MFVRLLILHVLLCTTSVLLAQDPLRFKDEISKFKNLPDEEGEVIFTGSSSVRMWDGLQEAFPQQKIVNTGFGGSHMSDLLYYADEAIIRFQPEKVFIYEGDNDINSGKSSEVIIEHADSLMTLIHQKLPNTKVYFISAKPSIARWPFKDKYIEFNQKLKSWTEGKVNVEFIDVWEPMMGKTGVVRKDIFLKDNLHMNKKGYKIWSKVMGPYL